MDAIGPAGFWNKLPDELKGQVFDMLDTASVHAMRAVTPRDASEANRRLSVNTPAWEARVATHPWRSNAAQQAQMFILQSPRPALQHGAAGMRGIDVFRYVYERE